MRISDWSSDVCSSDLEARKRGLVPGGQKAPADFSGVTAATDTTANRVMDRAINGGRQFIDAHQQFTGAMGHHAMNPLHGAAQAVSHSVQSLTERLPQAHPEIGRAPGRESVCPTVPHQVGPNN